MKKGKNHRKYRNNVTIIIRNSMYTRYNSVLFMMTDNRYIGN